jgi:DNA repair exonuclease SbcCD ATPase subunit
MGSGSTAATTGTAETAATAGTAESAATQAAPMLDRQTREENRRAMIEATRGMAADDAHYESLLDEAFERIDSNIEHMRRSRREIDDLKAETRALLRSLRAA